MEQSQPSAGSKESAPVPVEADRIADCHRMHRIALDEREDLDDELLSKGQLDARQTSTERSPTNWDL